MYKRDHNIVKPQKNYTSNLWYCDTFIYYGKLWYYGENYDDMDKTTVLWIKLRYYSENYGTFRKEKTWQITENQETLIYNGKKYCDIPK